MFDSNRYTRLTLPVAVLLGLTISVFTVTGCDSVGSESSVADNVEVGFSTSYTTSKTAPGPKAVSDSLVLTGSNGDLTITDIRLVVAEVKVEGEEDSTDFEADPSFLDLPLDTTEIAPVAASQLPPGTYTEFKFEVEDVDLEEEEDEEDDDEEELRALRDSIHQDFPAWPDEASMVVVGTFTPDGDTARSFVTYFEAEVKVERELSPPLEVTGTGLSRTLTVQLDPTQWFGNADGTVRNLASNDYDSTGELVEFEAKFEDGVTKIEFDEDDEDEDNDEDEDSDEDEDGDDD